MERNIMNVINNIENLKININEDEHKVNFKGNIKADHITVDLSLSVAPSTQSMLSRQGVISCTVWIKVNGNSAFYTSNLDRDQMRAIGGFIADCEDQVRKEQEKKAYEVIEDLI